MKLHEVKLTKKSGPCEVCQRVGIHCPACGSRNFYSKRAAADYIPSLSDGIIYRADGFVCRRCGIEFSTATKCEAPVGMPTMAERRKLEAAVDSIKSLTTTDRIDTLRGIFEERKIKNES